VLAASCAFATGCGAGPRPSAAVTRPRDRCAELTPLFEPLLAAHSIASASVALVDVHGSELCSFGNARDDQPATPDTLYEIGSLTKLFTALSLGALVEQGQAQLEQPLSALLPAASQMAVNQRPITLLDLAMHRSGLPRMPDNLLRKDPENPYADYDNAQLFAYLAHAHPDVPGQKAVYSNLGAALLGQALAQRVGAPYAELVRRSVLSPLGMTDTYFSVPETAKARRAQGHDAEGAPRSAWDLDAFAPAGGLHSTARDMARFTRAALLRGSTSLGRAFELAEQPRADADGGRRIGLFFQTRPNGWLWHNGETGGFASYWALDPEHQQGVAVLLSSAFERSDELGDRVLYFAAGKPLAPLDSSAPSAPSAPRVLEQRAQARGFEYVFRASRLANLAWELDCLSSFGRCSQPAYEQLWRDTLSADPELRSALARWGVLRRSRRGPVGESEASSSLLPLPHQQADLWQRVRLASVTAADSEQYEQLLYALTDRPTATELRRVLDRFDVPFEPIWAQALPTLGRAVAQQIALQARDDVAATVHRVAAFYGAPLGPHPAIHFDLLFRPESRSADFGTQLLDHGLIEIVASASPAQRIQVPVHELFHYLFASTDFAARDALASRFAASADPNALAAFGLLDEVLATGLAQGVLGRELDPEAFRERLATPGRLYGNPYIDAVTKAFLPELSKLLVQGTQGTQGTVFTPEFLTAYLVAVRQAFPGGVPPAAELRPLACAFSRAFGGAYQALSEGIASPVVGSAVKPDSEDARGLLEEHASWGRVLLLKSDEIAALQRYTRTIDAKSLQAVRAAARANTSFGYAVRPPGQAPLFVLMADDEAAANHLVGAFLALDARFEGLGLRTARHAATR
jgi:D-alanyl-D-alanine-carboxypeptidase/D-alanyl-D-alanine-endopeptidase